MKPNLALLLGPSGNVLCPDTPFHHPWGEILGLATPLCPLPTIAVLIERYSVSFQSFFTQHTVAIHCKL